jgi:hypothetical protein
VSSRDKNLLAENLTLSHLDIKYWCVVVGYYRKFTITLSVIIIKTHSVNLKPLFCSTGTKVLITTGHVDEESGSSSTTTEVVDVVSGQSCADLDDFPLSIYGAVGASLNGTPTVCGGNSAGNEYLRTCYKYTNTGWQQFTNMKEKKGYAYSVMYKDKFHIFGGYDRSNNFNNYNTTEFISIDGGVEYGPDLPVSIDQHAITSINSTVSILSAGYTNTESPLTWFFNHETNVFSSGPSLLERRKEHGSATCVDKITKAKIPIVTGGSVNTKYLDSTEMLINGTWQSGNKLALAYIIPTTVLDKMKFYAKTINF